MKSAGNPPNAGAARGHRGRFGTAQSQIEGQGRASTEANETRWFRRRDADGCDRDAQCRQDFVFSITEGCLRIAWRFNAGTAVTGRQVPEGRLKSRASAVPPGLIPQEPQIRR